MAVHQLVNPGGRGKAFNATVLLRLLPIPAMKPTMASFPPLIKMDRYFAPSTKRIDEKREQTVRLQRMIDLFRAGDGAEDRTINLTAEPTEKKDMMRERDAGRTDVSSKTRRSAKGIAIAQAKIEEIWQDEQQYVYELVSIIAETTAGELLDRLCQCCAGDRRLTMLD